MTFVVVRQNLPYYRHKLDRLKQKDVRIPYSCLYNFDNVNSIEFLILIIIILQIVWEPYLEIYESLPHICLEGSHVWRAVLPLIFFHIVEWHQPN